MSDENLEHFFCSSETLFCIVSLEGAIRRVNSAWQSTLGYAPEEMEGFSFLELAHPEESNLLLDHVEYLSTGARALVFSLRTRHRNGSYRHILWQATVCSESYSFYASGIDFTGMSPDAAGAEEKEREKSHAEAEALKVREQVEKTMRAANARLRFTVEHLPIMVDAFDAEGRIVLWNKECERVTGFSAEEIAGNPDSLEFLYPEPEYRKKMLSAVKNVFKEDPGYRSGEWSVMCKDGAQKTILWSVNSKLKIPGFPVWGVGVDVTQRKRALLELQDNQKRLERSEANLRYTIEHLPVMVDAMDENGIIVLWNRKCEEVSGYSAEEMVGNPKALELIYPDLHYREKMGKAVQRTITDDPGFGYGEWVIVCKNGKRKTIAWTVNTKLKIPGFAVWGVGEDVTERNQALRSLRTNEYRFRTLVENMPVMLKAYDAGGNLVMWNRQCEKVTGYPAADMINNPQALSVLYPVVEHRLHRDVYMEQEGITHWETEVTCRNGSRKIIAWSDESRQFPISGWARWLVGEDITDQAKARKARDEDNSMLHYLLDSLEDGVCATNAQEKIIYANQALCSLSEYSVEELYRMGVAELLSEGNQSFICRHYFSFFNGAHGGYYNETLSMQGRRGQSHPINLISKRADIEHPGEAKARTYVFWIFERMVK